MKKVPYFLSRSACNLQVLLFLLVLMFAGCECGKRKTTFPDWTEYLSKDKPGIVKEDVDRQLIVFIKPGTDRNEFNRFVDSAFISDKKYPLTILPVCESCDSTVLLLQGSGVDAFISGEVAKGGSTTKTKATVSGENGVFYFSSNKLIGFDLSQLTRTTAAPLANISYTDSVTIAVFDTGLEPGFFEGYLFSDPDTLLCIKEAGKGWNFPGWSANWKDDHQGLHGTLVSKFILNEVERYRKTKAKILPLKVFDSTGTTDLYTLLCGFAFAGKSKADIVNASFGFYESKYKFRKGELSGDTTSSALLKNFIYSYLTQKNKLLLCAAGNSTDDVPDIRDLDKINFYPASLSPVLANIIPVTTVGIGEKKVRVVSPAQNFSPSVVQLGVDADVIEGDHFGFVNPLDPSAGEIVVGSSFAAPVVTGKLAAYFDSYKSLLQQPATITNAMRDSIFTIIRAASSPAFLVIDSSLTNKIAGGKVILRGAVPSIGKERAPLRKVLLEKELRVRK
ncbi:MAG: S8/S53 family peptidase [Chitinophagaceae bacterium]|nr:S8/S53 family peptidase [Chitinophagaceae bacterium]